MLLKKVVGRSRFYDIVHKGWVNTCVAVTLGTVGGLAIFGSYSLLESTKNKEELVNKEAITDLATTITQKEGESL